MGIAGKRIPLGVGALAAAVLGATPAAAPAALSCGKTVMKSVKLKADLLDCPDDGLIAGVTGITIDLNGHRLDGSKVDNSRGISTSGHGSLLVRGPGRISGFDDGIYLGNSPNTRVKHLTVSGSTGNGIFWTDSDGVRVKRNTVKRTAAYGIDLTHSANARIVANHVIGPDASPFVNAGISVNASDSTGNLVRGNVVTAGEAGASSGIWVNGTADATTIEGNSATGFDNRAIYVYDNSTDTVVQGNEVFDNPSDGIVIGSTAGSGSQVLDNVAKRNDGDGIELNHDAVQVGGNRSNKNGGWGILASAVIVDLGGNSASGNTLGQCSAGIAC